MNKDTRASRSKQYREQAASCRQSASKCTTAAAREDYLRMAARWDQLANEVLSGTLRVDEKLPC